MIKQSVIKLVVALLCIMSVGDLYGGEPASVVSSGEGRVNELVKIDSVLIHFHFDGANIDRSYLDNAKSLERIDEILSDPNWSDRVDSITMRTVTSPEGGVEYNVQLSKSRAAAVNDYLSWYYPAVRDRLRIEYTGENWEGLRAKVAVDSLVPHRKEVLDVIDADINLDTKEWRLKRVGGGESWRYLKQNILPYLRYGVVTTVHYSEVPKERERVAVVYELTPYSLEFPGVQIETPESNIEEYVVARTPIETQITKSEIISTTPLFALKTNLLFDLATLINLEVEVPIGDRYSVAFEGIFPQWIWDNGMENSQRDRIQADVWTIEGRYWFGNRENVEKLTGIFGGVYFAAGSFDFEQNRKGIQSRNLFSAGVVGGYAHSISKCGNLRLEYSIALGYAGATIKEYTAEYDVDRWGGWRAFRDRTLNFTWFGPTKAKVSLVWMFKSRERRVVYE